MPQQKRRQHGRKRQGHQARHHHRTRQGQGKLGKQTPSAPRRKGQGRIDRHQRHGHCHNGKTHLSGATNRSLKRLHALLNMPVYVFQHDDRIINHQANCQHQGQQGQRVDAKTGHRHQGKSPNQGHRYRQQWNDRRSQRAQEYKNNQGHQHRGLKNGHEHAVDRALNKHRVVVGHLHLHAGRQVALHLDQQLANTGRQIERIGCGLADHAHPDRVAAIQAHAGALVHRGLLDPRHIGDSNGLPIHDAYHHLREFLRPLQVSRCCDIEFPHAALNAAGRHFQVGASQRVFKVLNGQPVSGEFVGVYPNPHGKLALALHDDISSARGGLQHRLDQCVGHFGEL